MEKKFEFWSLMMNVIRDFLAEMFVAVGHEADVAATGPEGIDV
jgi:hypothetical protein